MININRRVLIVNPFSSAKYLDARFKEYGVYTVALYTIDLNNIPQYLYPPKEIFDEQLFLTNFSSNEIIKQLGEQKFNYVINGFEPSVEISDQLSNYYTPQFANNASSSILRMNKYEMHRALAKNNLAHIHQYLYSPSEQLPNIYDIGFTFPCFVKPLSGLASVGAVKINTERELEDYFIPIELSKKLEQSKVSQDKFIIAEYISGDEFLIDTFSVDGNHHFSSIQKYNKFFLNGKPVHGYTDVITNKNILKNISDYISKVLDVLDYKNGFAHSEVFITSAGEVKLIEVNCRVSGSSGYVNRLAKMNNLPDQIDLLMKYIFKDISLQPSTSNLIYRRLTLFNLSQNPMNNLKVHLSKYKTFFEIYQIVSDGHIQTNPDISLVDAVAFVLLRSERIDDLEQDTQQILEEDKTGWI